MASTCNSCCPACSRHFASVAAFDAHRVGDHRSSDPATRRRCADPLDVQDQSGGYRFADTALAGACRMRAVPIAPVTVWALRRNAAEDARLRILRGPPRMAGEAGGETPHGPLAALPGWSEAA